MTMKCHILNNKFEDDIVLPQDFFAFKLTVRFKLFIQPVIRIWKYVLTIA